MKETIENTIVAALVAASFYAVVSFAAFGSGLVDSSEYKGKTDCLEHPTNFEILFPAYKMGCWLGAKQGEKYYWSKP